MLVGCRVGNRQWAGDGHLDRPVTPRLRGFPVTQQETGFPCANVGTDGWQVGFAGIVTEYTACQMVKIETVKVPTVIVTIILAPLFAVGRNINAAGELVGKGLPD